MEEAAAVRKPIVIHPEEGRAYEMGRMRAVFKADLEESAHRYSFRSGGWSRARAGRGCISMRKIMCSM
jgi:hypothetical protein